VARAAVLQSKFEIAKREPRVLAHNRFGARSLSHLDRAHRTAMVILRDGHDRVCLSQFSLHHHERAWGCERKIHRPPELAFEDRTVGQCEQQCVEARIEADIVGKALHGYPRTINERVDFEETILNLRNSRLGDPAFGCQPRGEPLERAPRISIAS
jgi:hypothetical protein